MKKTSFLLPLTAFLISLACFIYVFTRPQPEAPIFEKEIYWDDNFEARLITNGERFTVQWDYGNDSVFFIENIGQPPNIWWDRSNHSEMLDAFGYPDYRQ